MSEPASHTLVQTLRGVPNFASLEEAILLEIVGASVNLYWHAGGTVFEADDSAEALYVVLSGCVRILETVSGEQREVAELGPGDYFGENALLHEVTHTRTAVTSDDSELLVLPKDSFRPLLDGNPDLADRLERTLERRDGDCGGGGDDKPREEP
ncbi:MAG: cyclic nucleotide-binding domain-containing protein [Actinomycetota bacterium]|nr:cyclic nucleotide-binding domain-containing protein [Actinomycetota bacterium]